MIEIKKVTYKEAAIIALLGRITFTETFAHYFKDKQDLLDYYEQTFSVAKIESSLKKSNNVYWIAYWDKLPIGYAKLKINSNTDFIPNTECAQLQKIYVLKDFLGKKVGWLLMNELMAFFNQTEQSHIWLSVLQENKLALSFYKKFNLKKVATHNFQIGKEVFNFNMLSLAKKNNSLKTPF